MALESAARDNPDRKMADDRPGCAFPEPAAASVAVEVSKQEMWIETILFRPDYVVTTGCDGAECTILYYPHLADGSGLRKEYVTGA